MEGFLERIIGKVEEGQEEEKGYFLGLNGFFWGIIEPVEVLLNGVKVNVS